MKNIEQVASAIRKFYPNSVKSGEVAVLVEGPNVIRVKMKLASNDTGWEIAAREIQSLLHNDEGVKTSSVLVNVVEECYADPDIQGIEVCVIFYGKH